MKKSNDEQLLTLTELQCLKVFEDIDEETVKLTNNSLRKIQSQLMKDDIEDGDFDIQYEISKGIKETKLRLEKYRQKSQTILNLSHFLREFQLNFKKIIESKDDLKKVIKEIQGDSGIIFEKQNKLQAISIEIQENLDYYNYIKKFKFEFSPEISQREAYENDLQVILSQLTQGIQYFESHNKYTVSGRYLSKYREQKNRMLGFIKSFFLKFFHREYAFIEKYQTINLFEYFNSPYPKPTYKFLSEYLLMFPQFKKKLSDLITQSKHHISQTILKDFNFKEIEVEQFTLSHPICSLISYLEKNQKDLYTEIMLKFFLEYYRRSVHEGKVNMYKFKITEKQILPQFELISNYIIYICCSQYLYFHYCINIKMFENEQIIKNEIINILKIYYQLFKVIIKRITKPEQIHMICEIASSKIQQLPIIIQNYASKLEYGIYPLGRLFTDIKVNTKPLSDILKIPFENILVELEVATEINLPKNFKIKSIQSPCPQIQKFLNTLPMLKFCKKSANKFIITSLQEIIKSIKNINEQFQSRYECFIWNLYAIYSIHFALQKTRLSLVRTEMSLDMKSTVNMIQKVSKIQKKGTLIEYAKEIFSVISTGMPTVNELSLDFHQFMKTYLEDLKNQFKKDITFIFGKNMIEYLQNLDRLIQVQHMTPQIEANFKDMLQIKLLKPQYERFLINLQKYVEQSSNIYSKQCGYTIDKIQVGRQFIKDLIDSVFQNLLDLLSDFYIITGKYIDYNKIKEIDFEDIGKIRQKVSQKKKW